MFGLEEAIKNWLSTAICRSVAVVKPLSKPFESKPSSISASIAIWKQAMVVSSSC